MWWHEMCLELDIESHLDIADRIELLDGQAARAVETVCTNSERKAAWGLFLGDRPLLKDKYPIITLGG